MLSLEEASGFRPGSCVVLSPYHGQKNLEFIPGLWPCFTPPSCVHLSKSLSHSVGILDPGTEGSFILPHPCLDTAGLSLNSPDLEKKEL